MRRTAAVLAALPASQRRAVELAVLCGSSYADDSRSTGLPVSRVKTHLRRGLLKVREAMQRADRRPTGGS